MDIFLPYAKLETQKGNPNLSQKQINLLSLFSFHNINSSSSLSLGYLSIQLKSVNYLMSTIAGMVKTERGSRVTSIVNNVSLPPFYETL